MNIHDWKPATSYNVDNKFLYISYVLNVCDVSFK